LISSMTFSRKKYHGEHGGTQHGGELHWPGTGAGFPVRGGKADLRREEYENLPHVMDFHMKEFRLWEEEDKKEFVEVMDRVLNGWYALHKRTDNWNEEHQGLHVILEWAQIYGESPTGKSPGGSNGTVIQAIAAQTTFA